MNISLNGEALILSQNKTYYVIDPLYLDDIKPKINNLNKNDLDQEIKEKVFPFPYTEMPFAKINLQNDSFLVKNIRKVNYDDVGEIEKKECFSCDSGLVVFVEENLLSEFVMDFSYEDLVDSIMETINSNYWNKLTQNFNQNEVGLIATPGVSSGYEFEGSGTYKIVI